MRTLLTELYHRNRPLAITGWIQIGLLVPTLIAAAIDDRLILGINPWIKPMKFMGSILIFTWTMAWLLEYPKGRFPRSVTAISWAISVAMIIEIACITVQSTRGVPSHFNFSTPFDTAIFSTMGAMIAVNTLAVIGALVLFCTRLDIHPAYHAGIRLGVVLFLVGSFWGNTMIEHGAHTVGASDGGPGMPILNWSTEAGDLRAAHSLGLHALQILPLVGFLFSRTRTTFILQRVSVSAVFFLYLAAMVFVYNLAISGRPLFAG